MSYIQKIQITKVSTSNYIVNVFTTGLKEEHRIIIKTEFSYYFTKKSGNNQFITSLLFSPVFGLETNIRIYVYNYLLDRIEDIKHEFIDFNTLLLPETLDATYMMGGSDILNREWCETLRATKIDGPFQNGKKVKTLDLKQKVTFHASVNTLKANEVQLLSLKWKLIKPNKQEQNLRKARSFSITAHKEYVAVSFYLEEQADFTLFANFSSFTEAKLNYTTVKIEAATKTKVNFTIGMFFDGTGNNRFNSENVYYNKLNKKDLVYTNVPKEKKLPNGIVIDPSSSYWNPYSNIVLLHDLYETKTNKIDDFNFEENIKIYVQGIGTLKESKDDFWGYALGEKERGIIGKVADGCTQLAKSIKEILGDDKEIGSLTFDVFGFSRGAASARHFCNEILGKESIEIIEERIPTENKSARGTKNDNITAPQEAKLFKPIGRKYKLGLLGKALQLQNTQHEVKYYEKPLNSNATTNEDLLKDIKKQRTDYENNAPIKIRFMGLFDTVVAQMIVKNHLGKKLDLATILLPSPAKLPLGIGTLTELSFDKIKQKIDHLPIQQVVHLIAQDEWRANFASTNAGIGNNIFEIPVRGAHSDVGGGYMAKKEDRDIVAFDYVTTFDKNNIPKSDRLTTLKFFYIAKGYANVDEIKIVNKLIFEDYNSDWNTTKYYYLKQLIITRQITPRFSIVNMKLMQALAVESGLNFEGKTENTNYPFEYETPNELEKHQKELIDFAIQKFKGKQSKPSKNLIQKQKFVHLSANYNIAALFDSAGESITGIKTLDNVFYFNAPRYENDKNNSYKRETYPYTK
jgi:hypothetical protein